MTAATVLWYQSILSCIYQHNPKKKIKKRRRALVKGQLAGPGRLLDSKGGWRSHLTSAPSERDLERMIKCRWDRYFNSFKGAYFLVRIAMLPSWSVNLFQKA